MLSLPQLIIAGVIIAVVGGIALVVKPKLGIQVTGIMMLIASLGTWIDRASGRPVITWIAPLQTHRTLLFALVGGLMFFVFIGQGGRLKGARLPAQGVILLLIGLYGGVLRVIHGDSNDGFLTLILAATTVFPLILVVPTLLQTSKDFQHLARAIGFAGLVLLGATVVQIVLNRDVLLAGSRFTGFTSNPQTAGIVTAMISVNGLWLVLNDRGKLSRLTWIIITGTFGVLMLWTGSRTGLAMSAIGSIFILWRRLGSAVLFMPLVAIVGYIVSRLVLPKDASLATERLVSAGNTRSEGWQAMLETGLNNPLIGVGIHEAVASENSLLLAFSSHGLGMVFLVMLFYVLTAAVLWKLWRKRNLLPLEARPFVDLVLAHNAMYFGATITEGIMLSRVGPWLMFMLITSALSSRLIAMSEEGLNELSWDDDSPDDDRWANDTATQSNEHESDAYGYYS